MGKTTLEPERVAVDLREAAAMLGVSPRHLWTQATAGKVPYRRLGRRRLFSIEALKTWLATGDSE